MSFDKGVITLLLCFFGTLCFSQSKTVTYQTKTSVDQKVDGYSLSKYQSTLESFGDIIKIGVIKTTIDLSSLDLTTQQFDSIMENARRIGFANAKYNNETKTLTFNQGSLSSKFNNADIAHNLLWLSGLR